MSDQGSSTFKQDLEALRNRKSDAATASGIETAGHIGAGSIIVGNAAKIAYQARKVGAPIKPALRCFAKRVFVPLAAAMAGSAVADAIGADDMLVDMLGKPRQASKGRQPAHVGHRIAHNKSSRGFFTGLLAAALAGAAVAGILALTIGTGGLLGPVLIGFAAGFAYSAVAGMEKKTADLCGHIETGSPNVFFEGKPVARVNDLVICDRHSPPRRIMEGSKTIFINNYPLARIGHKITCSAVVQEGCNTIFADETSEMYGEPDSEISVGEQLLQSGIEVWGATSAVREGGLLGSLLRRLFGEPIDAATGDYASYQTDFTYPCVPPLQLTRAYAGKERIHGLMGSKWICNWSQRLVFDTETPTVLLEDAEGQRLRFALGKSSEFDSRHLKAPYFHLSGAKESSRLFDSRTQTTLIFTTSEADPQTGILSAIEDKNGNRIEFIYTAGRLNRVLCPDGAAFNVRTNGQGVIETVTREGETSPVVSYEYDSIIAMTDAISRFNGELHYRYNSQGWLTHWHDSGATKVDIEYDSEGRVIATRTPDGMFNDRFIYHPDECKTEYIDATGARTTIWFNGHNLPVREQDPMGNVTHHEWDHLERKLSTTDALGRITSYDYDSDGLLISETDWAGRSARIAHDSRGQITRIEYPNGTSSSWEYDGRGNLTSASGRDGTITSYGYDERGNPIHETGPDAASNRWEYTKEGRLAAFIDSLGHRTAFDLDLWGRPRKIIDPAGYSTYYEYDLSSENPREDVSRIIHSDGGEECFTYDLEGQPATHTTQEGQATRYSHGAFDLLRSITDARGYTTKLDYDGAARLKRITNAQGQKWTYSYDLAGNLAMETDWAGRQTGYTRDAIGRVVSKRLPDGVEQRITWDEQDRIVAVETSRQKIVYEYDGSDRLTRAATFNKDHPEPESDLKFIYDEKGWLIREIQNGIAIEYKYDLAGRCINRKSPSGETTFRYDLAEQFTGITSNGHGLDFTRDARGLETHRQYRGEGKAPLDAFTLKQSFDPCGRLKSQQAGRERQLTAHEKLAEILRRYTLDKAGRLIGLSDNKRGLSSYHYDPRDQITRITRQTGLNKQSEEKYSYDELLNLTHSDGQSHRYLDGTVRAIGPNTYHYDVRGLVIEKKVDRNGFRPRTWRYSWDDFDRLIEARTPDGSVWKYTYDAFGRRIKKECVKAGEFGRLQNISYLWQGATLAEEWENSGSQQTEVSRWHFEPGTFNLIAKETRTFGVGAEKTGEPCFYPIVTDHLGTPKEIFDTDGECLWQAEHELWGRTIVKPRKTKPGSHLPLVDCNLRFQNQWEDEETGLFYNLNRYYDPDSGQYLSPDPIGLEGGLRTHGYVHDPMQWVDPMGLAGVCPQDGLKRRLERLGYNKKNTVRIMESVRKGEKVVIVGENMKRVNAVANMVNKAGGQAITYKPRNWTGVNKNTLDANRSWARYWFKEKHATVIDIGRQPIPRVDGPSPFYGLENNSLRNWGIYTPF